jgi:hypothetical protein
MGRVVRAAMMSFADRVARRGGNGAFFRGRGFVLVDRAPPELVAAVVALCAPSGCMDTGVSQVQVDKGAATVPSLDSSDGKTVAK